MASIAIVGVGAIGGALAGFLQRTGGHEVTLCTRRPMPSLKFSAPEGEFEIDARNVTDPALAQPVDWVLVATKAYDAEGAAQWFPGLCANGSPVAIVQNGVEHRERFSPWVSAERLLPVVIECPVERAPDETVHVRGAALMKIEDTHLGRSFATLFRDSGAKIELTADFATALWWKLCVNSVGALSALALKPSSLLRLDAVRPLALEMIAECAAVGRAEGATLPDSIGEDVLALYATHPADSVNSLLADRLAGRRMEWDARSGAIVRIGEKHGIPTPLNRMAAIMLQAIDTNGC